MVAIAQQCVLAFFVASTGFIMSKGGKYRPMILLGFVLWAVAQGLLSTVVDSNSSTKLIGFMLLAGFGASLTFQTSVALFFYFLLPSATRSLIDRSHRTLTAIQAAVPRHEMGVATAVRNFLRIFGSAMVIPIASAIVNNRLREAMDKVDLPADAISAVLNDPTILRSSSFSSQFGNAATNAIIESYRQGFKGVFYMTVACQGIAILSAVFLIQEHDLFQVAADPKAQNTDAEPEDVKEAVSAV